LDTFFKVSKQKYDKKYTRQARSANLYKCLTKKSRLLIVDIHIWGTTAFKKEDVKKAIVKYDKEQDWAQEVEYT